VMTLLASTFERIRSHPARHSRMPLSGIQVFRMTRMKQPCVYILASKPNGTLYTGVTSDLRQRIPKHQQDGSEGFTAKYDVHRLVWYEELSRMDAAITREKQIKKWNRVWKVGMIEKSNPDWRDLFDDLF